jgi:LuxR family transcriptional regulator, maltose regulon positive regulatory protein
VSTKLAPPSVEEAMRRTRLFDVLDAARERPVIWIGAPAGSGKSTLVASYASARRLRCLWYGVDGRDADPGALFYYLGQGADLNPVSGTPALPTLSSDHPAGTLGFARRFFEACFSASIAGSSCSTTARRCP